MFKGKAIKKILVVGGVAGGASTAARLRRLSENYRIIMFERGPHVSFSNCCLPYHIGGVVKTHEELVIITPEQFMNQYRIEARVRNEVLSIDRAKKEILVKNLDTGEEYTESYDKLVLSPGAKAIVPPIPGLDKINYFTVRNVVDIQRLKNHVEEKKVKKVAVIGGGFIGIEVAENLKEAGYDVTLVEALPQILKPFDYDMVQILHKSIYDHGIELIVGDKVDHFEDGTVVLGSGKKVQAKEVVLAIGVTPEIKLAKDCGLEISPLNAIAVNNNYLTSDPDIYAAGDVVEVFNSLTHSKTKLALAGPAQKQARAVANHIDGIPSRNTGFIGSSCIKVFDYNGASTGLTEGLIQALKLNIPYDTVHVIPQDIVGLMPGSEPLHFKLIYEIPTGRILGAQAIGRGDAAKRIDVVASLIKMAGTVYDLADLELCYAPPFGTAKDVVNMAGLVATNLLAGTFRQVKVHEARTLWEEGAAIIDVREPEEYEKGHIVGAKNIPLSQIRDRVSEIPKDKPVYLHCRSAQRSYNACLALIHMGFENIYNMAGGFMGISFYEYFNDQITGRKKMVTEYNFE